VPFNVIWVPGQTEPVILPELLTPGTVLDAVKQIPAVERAAPPVLSFQRPPQANQAGK